MVSTTCFIILLQLVGPCCLINVGCVCICYVSLLQSAYDAFFSLYQLIPKQGSEDDTTLCGRGLVICQLGLSTRYPPADNDVISAILRRKCHVVQPTFKSVRAVSNTGPCSRTGRTTYSYVRPLRLCCWHVWRSINLHIITSDKGGGTCFARVCLSVCLSVSKITQKRVHGFGWNVACRQMSGHGQTD